jgi:hypothetical protein
MRVPYPVLGLDQRLLLIECPTDSLIISKDYKTQKGKTEETPQKYMEEDSIGHAGVGPDSGTRVFTVSVERLRKSFV